MGNDWKKYVIVFFITAALFAVAAGLSNFFSNKRIADIKTIQTKLSTDILSSETQFLLLSELSCEQDDQSGDLSSELNNLAEKINYSENNFKGNAEIIELKKEYTLLEIKDYILIKKINKKCGEKFVPLLYFYTTANNCTECVKQGFVLTELRQKYPDVRVYSFDYNLKLSALKALLRIYKIKDTRLPAIVVNDKKEIGFKTVNNLKKTFPEILKLLPKKLKLPTTTSKTKNSKASSS